MHSHNVVRRRIPMGVYIMPCTDNHFFLSLVYVYNELNLIAKTLTLMVIYITDKHNKPYTIYLIMMITLTLVYSKIKIIFFY